VAAPVFRIDPEIFNLVPTARFYAVVVRGIDNRRGAAEAAARLAEATAAVRESFDGRDPKSAPEIAVWRDVFGARGWTPSKYLSSIEALVRRVVKTGSIPSINPAVDLGNAASLTYLVPIGAHDLGTAPDGITVRLAGPDDVFRPMGDAPDETPDQGEIVYAHGTDIRTRRWVWRQSRTGLVSPETTDLLYPIDAFAGITDDAARQAAEALCDMVPALLGGHAMLAYLDAAHPELRD